MSLAVAASAPLAKIGNAFALGFGTLTFSGSYATGGDACDIAALFPEAQGLQPVAVIPVPNPVAGWCLTWDKANKKMLVYVNTAGGADTALGQHTAAALNASLTGATIYFIAIFRLAA